MSKTPQNASYKVQTYLFSYVTKGSVFKELSQMIRKKANNPIKKMGKKDEEATHTHTKKKGSKYI